MKLNPDDKLPATAADRLLDPVRTISVLLVTALQSMAEGVVITDLQGRVEFVNRTAEEFTGLPSATAVGQPLPKVLRLVEGSGRAVAGDLVALAIVNGSAMSLGTSLFLCSSNGDSKPIEGEIAVRTDAGICTGTVVTFRDITARRRSDLHREEERKARAVGQLAGAVAHRVNNLLTVVLGHTEVLDETCGELVSLRTSTAEIRRAADEMALVTRHLLTLSRQEVLLPTPVDLNALVDRCAPQLQSLVYPNVTLKVVTAADLGSVLVDPGRLEQALLALVAVACTRTPQGGIVRITTETALADEGCRARHLQRFVQLTIQDCGPSLDEAAVERLLQPAWLHEAGHASGLGLGTARNFAGAAGGHFSVESTLSGGAKFILSLPYMEQDLVASQDQALERTGDSVPTVLLVEDDHAIRILLHNALQKRGYNVLEARDGAEALLQADLHEGAIDMLVSDVLMPSMDGPTLARELVKMHPETAVLLISGCPGETAPITQLVYQGAQFLQKPFTQYELLARVDAILGYEQQDRCKDRPENSTSSTVQVRPLLLPFWTM